MRRGQSLERGWSVGRGWCFEKRAGFGKEGWVLEIRQGFGERACDCTINQSMITEYTKLFSTQLHNTDLPGQSGRGQDWGQGSYCADLSPPHPPPPPVVAENGRNPVRRRPAAGGSAVRLKRPSPPCSTAACRSATPSRSCSHIITHHTATL